MAANDTHTIVTLADLFSMIPPADMSGIVKDATDVSVDDPVVQAGPTPLSYRLHPTTRTRLVQRTTELLQNSSATEVAHLVHKANQLIYWREFGHPNLVRNCKPDEPYWFETHLVQEIEQHLKNHEPARAYGYGLTEHNHGHSGFVLQTVRVYMSPRNEEERKLSQKFRELHLAVAEGLLSTTKPTTDIFEFFDIEAIHTCLERLGADVPKTLSVRLQHLIDENVKLAGVKDFMRNRLVEMRKGVATRFAS